MTVEDRNGDLHDESNGQYTEKGTGAKSGSIRPGEGERAPWTEKEKPKERKKIPLDYFGKKGHKPPDITKEIPPAPKEAFGFGEKDKLLTHFEDHGADFGCKNEEEYQNLAIHFWNKSPGEMFYIAKRNRIAKIGKDGLTIAICDADGTIHTFFKFKNRVKKELYMRLDDWRKYEEK